MPRQRQRRRRKACSISSPQVVAHHGSSALDILQHHLGDGKAEVSKEELWSMLTHIGLQATEVSTLLQAVDARQDGKVECADFLQWLFTGEPDVDIKQVRECAETDLMVPIQSLEPSLPKVGFRECRLDDCTDREFSVADAISGVFADMEACNIEAAFADTTCDCVKAAGTADDRVKLSDLALSQITTEESENDASAEGVFLDESLKDNLEASRHSRFRHSIGGANETCSIAAASLEMLVPPHGVSSWDWPLSRHEKKVRVDALGRNLQLMDQQILLEELEELREFRRFHDESASTSLTF
jgi:hypothetical protein